ncbi:SCO3933 family regulatory protein [Streptomyces sp. NPDC055037]
MQSIPVDVTRLGTLMVVVPPEPRVVPDTGEIRKDREGNSIYVTGVSVRQTGTRRADVIEVATPGEPSGLAEGMRVHVADLVAVAWEIDGRKGTSFRASGIAPAAPAQAPPVPASRSRTAGAGDPRA